MEQDLREVIGNYTEWPPPLPPKQKNKKKTISELT